MYHCRKKSRGAIVKDNGKHSGWIMCRLPRRRSWESFSEIWITLSLEKYCKEQRLIFSRTPESLLLDCPQRRINICLVLQAACFSLSNDVKYSEHIHNATIFGKSCGTTVPQREPDRAYAFWPSLSQYDPICIVPPTASRPPNYIRPARTCHFELTSRLFCNWCLALASALRVVRSTARMLRDLPEVRPQTQSNRSPRLPTCIISYLLRQLKGSLQNGNGRRANGGILYPGLAVLRPSGTSMFYHNSSNSSICLHQHACNRHGLCVSLASSRERASLSRQMSALREQQELLCRWCRKFKYSNAYATCFRYNQRTFEKIETYSNDYVIFWVLTIQRREYILQWNISKIQTCINKKLLKTQTGNNENLTTSKRVPIRLGKIGYHITKCLYNNISKLWNLFGRSSHLTITLVLNLLEI